MHKRKTPRQNHGCLSQKYMAKVALRVMIGIVLVLVIAAVSRHANAKEYVDYVNRVCQKKCMDAELLRMATYASAEEHSVDPALLFAVFQVESSFNPKAVNRIGGKSVGLGQIQVYWHKEKFKTKDRYDVFDNTSVSAEILANCLKRHKNHRIKSLWCYNGHQKHGIKRYALKVEKIYQNVKKQAFFI